MDCGDIPGPKDPHSSSQVASYSVVCVCMCVFYFPFLLYVCPCLYPDLFYFFCTEPWMLFGLSVHMYMCVFVCVCVCVCVFVFLYESLACREEADQALRISSVTAHQD